MRGQIARSLLFTCVLSTLAGPSFADSRQLQQLELRLDRLERAIDNQGVYEMQREINAIDQEMQDLRGEMERLRFELEEIKAQQREMFIAVDKKLQQLENSSSQSGTASDTVISPAASTDREKPLPAEDSASVTSSNSTTVQSGTSTGVTPEMTEEYKSAFILLKQSKYSEAIAAFETFLNKYSVNKYSANAQYWIAEANYVSKKYPDALLEFNKVVEQYPDSAKVPDARLKIGFTHYELQQWEEAKEVLSKLKVQYPNSEIAGLADQRLERMNREGH